MKKILFVISILLTTFTLKAQIVQYKNVKVCYGVYDRDLDDFTWPDKWSTTSWLELSPHAMKVDGWHFTFGEDIPSDKFSFDKKIVANYPMGTVGPGNIYGRTTLQELLSGSFKGDIYVYYEHNGSKSCECYRIGL